ncbi:hypothetical protein ACHAWF_010354 [Thalassiosira exigua]
MLGGLLTRQAEEAERRLREAEAEAEAERRLREAEAEAEAERRRRAAALDAGPVDDDVAASSSWTGSGQASEKPPTYGALDDESGEVVAGQEGVGRYDDAYGEEYSYDEDEDEDETDDDDGEDDDDSSALGEGSFLLDDDDRRRLRKRRKRRRASDPPSDWRSWLGRAGSRVRAAIVALADVDNVWDSPDAADATRRGSGAGGGRGAYDDDPSEGLDGSDEDHARRGRHRRASSILYAVVTGGTTSTRNNRAAAIFWFVCLTTSYATERSTFKLVADRVVPFRLFSAELILGAHAALTGAGMALSRYIWKEKDEKARGRDEGGCVSWWGLPLADIGLMAVLDTVYLLVGIISGAHVPPVLTVILVQTTIPLTACFTQCVHPDGRCARAGESTDQEESSPGGNSTGSAAPSAMHSHSNVRIISSSTLNEMERMNDLPYPDVSSIPNLPAPPPPPVKGWGGLSRHHILGTGLMFLAIFLGLTPAVLSLDHIILTKMDAMPERTAYNTIVFCLATIPAAMSQLYKEHTLTRLRQPIDRNSLNLVLSVFQLLFAVVVSPLAYGLQGMGDGPGWTSLYPSKRIGENFSDGLACFLGTLDEETMRNGYPETAECRWAWLLVLLHVISIILVGVAIDKLAAATKVMYRGVSMGIIFAVILMFVYQIRDQWCEYGPLVSFFHLTSTAILIVGAEIYHRVSLVDASFETEYPDIGDLYDDEE